jgi:nucleoside permease NupC
MTLALQSALGLLVLLGLAWAIGENRRAVPWRILISGVLLMAVMAALLLKVPLFKQFFFSLNDGLMALEKATQAGPRLCSVTLPVVNSLSRSFPRLPVLCWHFVHYR